MSEKLSKICGILTLSLKNVASFASYPTSSPPKAGVKKEEKKRRKKSSKIDLRHSLYTTSGFRGPCNPPLPSHHPPYAPMGNLWRAEFGKGGISGHLEIPVLVHVAGDNTVLIPVEASSQSGLGAWRIFGTLKRLW